MGYGEEIGSFISYFERAYIGRKVPIMDGLGLKQQRRPAIFSLDSWNKSRVIGSCNYLLTNNAVEAYNSTKNPVIKRNASVWNVILQFIREENSSRLTYVEACRGNVEELHVFLLPKSL